jgi:hypothetical protein
MVSAPLQVPFAPKPLSSELISSWLLRVAAANHVSLADLLHGFESQYSGTLLAGELIDCSLSIATLSALCQFCRVPIKTLHALDLRQRVPLLNPALLLRFSKASVNCPRGSYQRARYAFCPSCLFTEPVTHIRWDWSLACVIRCSIHRIRLHDGCELCGESDPLTFLAPHLPPNFACRSCGGDLTEQEECETEPDGHIEAVETAYRNALSGVAPHPTLIGKTTDAEFRRFVDDMLQLLSRTLSQPSASKSDFRCSPMNVPRKDILAIISELIRHAAPSSDARLRRSLNSRSAYLWSTLLDLIPDREGQALEQTSRYWPLALRRRFASGLKDRTKKRWPYTPYGRSQLSKRFKYKVVTSYRL